MDRPLIDYSLLAQAVAHYRDHGFQQVEVPWLVSPRACFATLPLTNTNLAMPVGDQFLVGSAEQGFLEIDLPAGRYMAVSPCFRAGEIDDLHQETFMKVELHQTDDVSDDALATLMWNARTFFRDHCRDAELVKTSDGWDIEIKGIEVGSYGRRVLGDYVWLYGTGVALPRLDVALGR